MTVLIGRGKDTVSDAVDAEGFSVESRPGRRHTEEFRGDLLDPMASVFEFCGSAYLGAKFTGNGIEHHHIGSELLPTFERSNFRHSVACCLAHIKLPSWHPWVRWLRMTRSVLFRERPSPADRTREPILHLTAPLFRMASESQGSFRRTRDNTD